jgi:HK97 family phage portal protein
VNVNSSLTLSAFYCGVDTISNSLALLPTSVFQKKEDQREHFPAHPADYLLYAEPNQYMTAFTFKKIMCIAVLLRGNAYALIVRDNAGNINALQYLDPDMVTVIENNGKLFYKYKSNVYAADEILHIPGFSFNGITGKSVIAYAADSLGVALSAQKFGSDSLHNRGISHGVLETDKSLDPGPKKNISNAFAGALNGGEMHRSAVLDEGMKYKPLSLKPAEAQFIETYAAGIQDVARWLGIPSFKLHIEGEGGYNFLVQMSIEYLQTGVMPRAQAFKEELQRKLFTKAERSNGLYINQNYKKLLQADPKARGQFYKDMVFLKAMTPNEVRELEDMNPYDGGDEFLQMSNLLNEQQVKTLIKDGTE